MTSRLRTARIVRVVVAGMFLVGLLAARDLALPGRTFACSCAMPNPGGEDAAAKEAMGWIAATPETILIEGVVISMNPGQGVDNFGHTRGEILVKRVYKGNLPSARMPVIGGGGGDCTMSLSVGDALFTAAAFDGTSITPGLCSFFGEPGSPQAQPYLVAALAAFGPGVVPPGGEGDPDATAPPPAAPGPVSRDLALPLVFGGLVVIVVGLFGAIALVARRPRGSA